MEVMWLLFSSYGFIQCDVLWKLYGSYLVVMGFIQCDVLWKLCGFYLVVMGLFSVMYNGSYVALI